MLRLGWQTYWQQVGDAVSPARVRRAFGVALAAMAVAAAGMTVFELGRHWTGLRPGGATVIVLLLALGVGLVAFACCPLSGRSEPVATINGRQVRPDTARTVRSSIQRYLAVRPPAIAPEDREAVLIDTALYRRGVIVDLTRGTALVAGGVLAAISFAVVGSAHVWPVLMLVYAGNLPSMLTRLGRAERARREAASL
ncbi:hypothetical protein [Curtobacterium sp. VKM Ac-2922]|uniref:hypothetical protein n=1 Tax=Curtobacterium sp. VKM Ac-2922 TaxID=2929475 RepID=UPI001FB30E9D|nr:hypothetical protein [Curtobacterium sp. VKM Ac-2922]MCJ1714164.1 hypothetical protein [Curtobacterium sp. VKM Ac-2922]